MSKSKEQSRVKPTAFTCHSPAAQQVFLAGTFNDWKPDVTPMVRGSDGNWSVGLKLSPGRYEFKFVVDGVWCRESGSDDGIDRGLGCVPNEFGTMNRVIEVA